MPRRPRVHMDNVPLHIVQRGHNREPCFFGKEDYQAYLRRLGSARFYAMIGQRREARPRGRPKLQRDQSLAQDSGQGELPL